MQKITTFLTFDDQAEAAAAHYASIFKSSKIVSTSGPPGAVMAVTFELEGQRFIALNGGPSFSFSQGISLFVSCETQDEIDALWDQLCAGGTPGRCGWLTDKFGVSWQVVPPVLGELLGHPDRATSQRVLQAMLQMSKLDIATLQRAARG